jgi:hypothetical protein
MDQENNSSNQVQDFSSQPPSPPLPPAPTPTAAPVAAPAHVKEPVNAGLIILQWLTYAFWGWTVLALSVLTGTVIANFVAGADTGSFTPYGIAAVLVLLPISYACDYVFSKKEPQKKVGAEILVMVIHAVIFALFGIGSLIVAVVAVVQLLTSSGDSSGVQATLYTALIVTGFYGITFLRTLNPGIAPWIRRFYGITMVISVGIIAILGIVGPVAQERTTRDDRLISAELSGVSTAINDYVGSNGKLPSDLGALSLSGDTKQVIDRKLVTYKPETTNYSTQSTQITKPSTSIALRANPAYRYQLCVTYKKASPGYGKYSRGNNFSDDGYSTYLSSYDHPGGEYCYKLKTSDY